MKAFEIYYVNFSQNSVGSEQKGVRPAVVVQSNIASKFSPTALVMPITSVLKKQNQPTHCVIDSKPENGLEVTSMVEAEGYRPIDKKCRLKERIGSIDNIEDRRKILDAFIANFTGKRGNEAIVNMLLLEGDV